jgi:hypothetical protein
MFSTLPYFGHGKGNMLKQAGRKQFFMLLQPIIGGYFAAGVTSSVFATKVYTLFMRTRCVKTMVVGMVSHVMTTT